MFDTDLGREYQLLDQLGVDASLVYQAGVRGALCDEVTRRKLAAIGDQAQAGT
jgi:aminodeoxyfutalosine deaminase